jgi:hypothetical protein
MTNYFGNLTSIAKHPTLNYAFFATFQPSNVLALYCFVATDDKVEFKIESYIQSEIPIDRMYLPSNWNEDSIFYALSIKN